MDRYKMKGADTIMEAEVILPCTTKQPSLIQQTVAAIPNAGNIQPNEQFFSLGGSIVLMCSYQCVWIIKKAEPGFTASLTKEATYFFVQCSE